MSYTRLLPWLVLGLIRTVPLAEACALRRGRRRLTARRTTTDHSPAGSLDTSDLYDLALHPPSIIEAHFQEIDGGMQLFRHVKHANNNNNNNNNNQANALWYGVTDKGDEIFLMPYRDGPRKCSLRGDGARGTHRLRHARGPDGETDGHAHTSVSDG